MIHAFRCETCNRYYLCAEADFKVRGDVWVDRTSGDIDFNSEDTDDYKILDVGEYKCYHGHPVSLVELDNCPHQWGSTFRGFQICDLCLERRSVEEPKPPHQHHWEWESGDTVYCSCGEKKKGKVVFDEG